MARYIDADKLIADIKHLCWVSKAHEYDAIRCVKKQPTADVVPKSEVVKIFEELEAEITAALKSNYEARRAYNPTDEFHMWVQGKIDALGGIDYFIAELKKKYTGDNKE